MASKLKVVDGEGKERLLHIIEQYLADPECEDPINADVVRSLKSLEAKITGAAEGEVVELNDSETTTYQSILFIADMDII